MKIPDFQLSAEEGYTFGFPYDMYRFLNYTQGQSASFFIFRQGVKPTYDDPEHAVNGGEFSFYFQLKNEYLKLDTALREMIFGLLTNTLLPVDKQTPNLPFGDFTGLSIVPKPESVTVKLWLCKDSQLHHKSPIDLFDPSLQDTWKLADAKYLPFFRPSAAAVSSTASSPNAAPSAAKYPKQHYHNHHHHHRRKT